MQKTRQLALWPSAILLNKAPLLHCYKVTMLRYIVLQTFVRGVTCIVLNFCVWIRPNINSIVRCELSPLYLLFVHFCAWVRQASSFPILISVYISVHCAWIRPSPVPIHYFLCISMQCADCRDLSTIGSFFIGRWFHNKADAWWTDEISTHDW